MKRKGSMLISLAAGVLIFAALAAGISSAGIRYTQKLKRTASAMLEAYRSNVNGTLDFEYNYAARLRDILYARDYDLAYMGDCAVEMIGEGIEYIAVTDKSRVTAIYSPSDTLQAGQRIEDLDYCYQLARLNAQAVREGPVNDAICGEKVFLIIEPFFRDNRWIGQIAVAVRAEAVYESFHLETLRQSGYDYLLWRVHPLNGHKENLVTSNAEADFSTAKEIRFEMPTVYTLSILPAGGWSAGYGYPQKYLYSFLIAVLSCASVFFILRTIRYRKRFRKSALRDTETGLLNKDGLIALLDREISEGTQGISLIYCMMHKLSGMLLSADGAEGKRYLDFIVGVFNDYVQSPHVTARITSDSFAVAIERTFSQQELENLGKGLAIELFRKIEVGNTSCFPIPEFGYAVWEGAPAIGADLLRLAVGDYENRRGGLSPALDLKKRCDAMNAGGVEVTRREYADHDMNELAKSVFRYYRKNRNK